MSLWHFGDIYAMTLLQSACIVFNYLYLIQLFEIFLAPILLLNLSSHLDMNTNRGQIDHRHDTDPFVTPATHCNTCHATIDGLRVFAGSTPANRHLRGCIAQTVCHIFKVEIYKHIVHALIVVSELLS